MKRVSIPKKMFPHFILEKKRYKHEKKEEEGTMFFWSGITVAHLDPSALHYIKYTVALVGWICQASQSLSGFLPICKMNYNYCLYLCIFSMFFLYNISGQMYEWRVMEDFYKKVRTNSVCH